MSAWRSASGAARAARAPRRDLRLGLTVLAVLGLAGWISTVAINGVPWASGYTVRVALPPGAPVLHPGAEVRVGGERVGQVSAVALMPRSADRAAATLSLDRGDVRAGARARIRPRGLAGAVYVELDPGSGRQLVSGTLIPGGGSVQLTDVISGFDAGARRAISQVMTGYGAGLAGRGVMVNHVLAATPQLLGDLTATLGALRPQPGALADVIGSAGTVAGALAGPGALPDLVSSARAVLESTAAHADALVATVTALPEVEATAAQVLPGANRLLAAATLASRALRPGVSALSRALPGLAALEREAPAIAQLGSVAQHAVPVLRAVSPVLSRLGGPAAALTPLSNPLAELAGVLTPYRTELVQAPLGFTRWGNFTYDFGTGAGHRAVRFSMILTCAHARDPYPAPGAAAHERKPCR
jgi:phospholipid/cholesterol/gamma-HCH transport system substrate-binding protein